MLREAGGNFGTLDVAGVLCAAGAENNLEMIQVRFGSMDFGIFHRHHNAEPK